MAVARAGGAGSRCSKRQFPVRSQPRFVLRQSSDCAASKPAQAETALTINKQPKEIASQ
jgi:hypothetical protein